jgi:hypothetical protein
MSGHPNRGLGGGGTEVGDDLVSSRAAETSIRDGRI